MTTRGHDHDHPHDDDHGHEHAHDARPHEHARDTPGTGPGRGLVVTGVSGGLLPCPTALVVLLAAISLHRVGYGLVLIVAFSIGLAATISGIGLLAIGARSFFKRLSFEGRLVRLAAGGQRPRDPRVRHRDDGADAPDADVIQPPAARDRPGCGPGRRARGSGARPLLASRLQT